MSNQSTNTKKPSLYAYQVREASDGKSFWTRIGAAGNIKDGLSIQLDAIPVDGRIVLQPPKKQANGS